MQPKEDYYPKTHSMPKSGINQISQAPPEKISEGMKQVTTPPKG